jgi:uncharacterized protein (DUF302 family)
MSNRILTIVTAALAGGAVTLGVIAFAAPRLLIKEEPSPFDLEETVSRLEQAAAAEGWTVAGVRKLDESVRKNGGPDLRPVRLVELCEPHHAGALLADDARKKLSVMMPCTISVYEKSDGRAYVSSLNAALVGRLYGGQTAEIMGKRVAREQEAILAGVRAPSEHR